MTKEKLDNQNTVKSPNRRSKLLGTLAPLVAAVALVACSDSNRDKDMTTYKFDSPKSATEALNDDKELSSKEMVAEITGAVEITKQDAVTRVMSIKDSIGLESDQYTTIETAEGNTIGFSEWIGKDGETITSVHYSVNGFLSSEITVSENTDGTQDVLYIDHLSSGATDYTSFEPDGRFSFVQDRTTLDAENEPITYITRMSLEGGELEGKDFSYNSPGYIKISPTDMKDDIAGSLQAVTEFVNTIEAATPTV